MTKCRLVILATFLTVIFGGCEEMLITVAMEPTGAGTVTVDPKQPAYSPIRKLHLQPYPTKATNSPIGPMIEVVLSGY